MENEALSLFLAEGADFRGVKRVPNWRVGRAVEGGSLENYCGCELTGGSNPSLSARKAHFMGRIATSDESPRARRKRTSRHPLEPYK